MVFLSPQPQEYACPIHLRFLSYESGCHWEAAKVVVVMPWLHPNFNSPVEFRGDKLDLRDELASQDLEYIPRGILFSRK